MTRTACQLPSSSWRPQRTLAVVTCCAVLVLGLSACGGVQIKPDPKLPRPLITVLPARVGLVLPPDMRNFTHTETRWGVDWKIDLGEGHTHLMREVFKDTFAEVEEFKTLEEARTAQGLKAIFEPRIEQYSFVTARETGGRYYAVSIRYRINLYTPGGEQADSLTLTGYGNALAKGLSSSGPLEKASLAAMRDAAAKFLVQFPEQPVGARLAKNEAVTVESTMTADAGGIETVPIEEPSTDSVPVSAPSTPASAPTEEPPPTPAPKASLNSTAS